MTSLYECNVFANEKGNIAYPIIDLHSTRKVAITDRVLGNLGLYSAPVALKKGRFFYNTTPAGHGPRFLQSCLKKMRHSVALHDKNGLLKSISNANP